MKQIWLIFCRDCRRFWPALLALGGVLAYSYVRVTHLPPLTQELPSDGAITWLLDIGLILLTALLILEDPLVGRHAFWMSRPIRWSSLLLAKSLFVILFLLTVPLMIQAAALLRLGLEASLLPRAALSSLKSLLPMLGVTASIAVLCRNLAAFSLGGILTLVATGALSALLRPWGGQEVPGDALSSQSMLTPLLYLLVALLVVIHQYSSRSTLRSWLTLASGIIGVTAFTTLMPTNLAWQLERLVQQAHPHGFRVRLPDKEVAGLYAHEPGRSKPGRVLLYLPLQAPSPLPYLVHLSSIASRLEMPGRTLTAWRNGNIGFGQPLGNGKSDTDEAAQAIMTPFLDLAAQDFERWSKEPVRLEARLYFWSRRESLLAELPVVQGARFKEADFESAVSRVDLFDRRLSVKVLGRRLAINSVLERNVERRIVYRPAPTRGGAGQMSSSAGGNRLPVILQGCGVFEFEDSFRYESHADDWRPDPEWVRAARVLLISSEPSGAFAQTIELEGLRLEDLTKQSWAIRLGHPEIAD